MENETSNCDARSPTTQLPALTHLLFSRSNSRLWCCLHTLRFCSCCRLSLLQESQQWTTCEQDIHMMQFSIGNPRTTPSTQHSIIDLVSYFNYQNITMTTVTVHVVASQVYTSLPHYGSMKVYDLSNTSRFSQQWSTQLSKTTKLLRRS